MIEKRDSTNGVRYARPMARKAARKLGRPLASNSVETRQRILDVARQTFADVGWEVTTNKVVAEKADVTSAAIYHYFDSKLEMYRAVHDDAEERVSAEFGIAAATSDTFVGQFEAVLERAYKMNSRDPSLARFLASVTCRHESPSRTSSGDPTLGGGRDRVHAREDGSGDRRDPSEPQEAGERARAGDPGRAERRGVPRSHAAASGDRRRPRPPRGQPARSVVGQRPEASFLPSKK